MGGGDGIPSSIGNWLGAALVTAAVLKRLAAAAPRSSAALDTGPSEEEEGSLDTGCRPNGRCWTPPVGPLAAGVL